MKRFILKSLTFFLFAGLAGTSFGQDTVKKAHVPLNAVRTPRIRPLRPAVRPANGADSAQAASVKSQIDPSQLNDKTLNGQYQYLLTKIYHYQEPLVAALWKNAMDTLHAERQKIRSQGAELAVQKAMLDSLKAGMNSKEQSLSESNAKADSISILGGMMPKSTFTIVMFSLVGGLIIALVVVILTTARHKQEAKYRAGLYQEIEEELKNVKAKAHEKELKLARELQTERNKLNELLGGEQH